MRNSASLYSDASLAVKNLVAFAYAVCYSTIFSRSLRHLPNIDETIDIMSQVSIFMVDHIQYLSNCSFASARPFLCPCLCSSHCPCLCSSPPDLSCPSLCFSPRSLSCPSLCFSPSSLSCLCCSPPSLSCPSLCFSPRSLSCPSLCFSPSSSSFPCL
jgi:hypothetical protein